MSIAEKITRLSTAKDNIATAITNKGGTVASGDGFEDFAGDIASIPSGNNWSDYASSISFNRNFYLPQTFDISLPNLTKLSNSFEYIGYNGRRYGIPYLTVRLTKQVKSMSYAFSLADMGGDDSRKITIIGDLSKSITYAYAFNSCSGTTEIDADLDFTSVARSDRVLGTFGGCNNLQSVRFVMNTLKFSIGLPESSALTNASLISIANGLNETATSQTLTLHATPKARLSTIMGTVTDGLFTQDASGTVSLQDFITNTKGWSIA